MGPKKPASNDSIDRDHLIMYNNPNQSHDPDARPSTPPSPLKEAEALLADRSIRIQFLKDFKDRFNAEPRPPSPASSSGGKQALRLKALADCENKIKVIEHILGINDPSMEEMQGHLDEEEADYNQLELQASIYQAQLFIEAGNAGEAEKMAQSAMETAKRISSEINIDIARVWYWKGRVEFLRGNISAARRCFLAAQPCAADDEKGIESLDIQFYLNVTREEINDQTRMARVEAYEKLIRADLSYDVAFINSIRVENKEAPALKSTTAMMNSLQMDNKKNGPPNTTRASLLPSGVIRVDQTSRKYLNIRRHVPQALQSCKGESEHVPTSHLPTEALLKDSTNKNTNTLGIILGGTLAEECGHKPRATYNNSIMGSTNEPTAKNKPVGANRSTAKATSDPFISPANLKITMFNKAPTKILGWGEPDASQKMYLTPQEHERLSLVRPTSLDTYLSVAPVEPFVFGIPHASTPQTQFLVGYTYVGRAKGGRPGTIFSPLPDEVPDFPEETKRQNEFNARKFVSYGEMELEKLDLL
jgi:tetratricopeptide (TPR) repeat protein